MKPFGQRVNEDSPYDLWDWPIIETLNAEALSIASTVFLPGGYDDIHTRLFPVVPDERVVFGQLLLGSIQLGSSCLSIETGEFIGGEIRGSNDIIDKPCHFHSRLLSAAGQCPCHQPPNRHVSPRPRWWAICRRGGRRWSRC